MIQKIGVLGAGTMGHGIAEAFAIHGYQVNIYEPVTARRVDALNEIRSELELMVSEGYISSEKIEDTLSNICFFDEFEPAVIDRDYVIESIPEIMELKQKTFQKLDEICKPDTIFASNTSSLSLNGMMALVCPERQGRMLVCHWYNPPHLMPLVELSYFGNMSDEVFREVEGLYKNLEKQTIKVRKDVPGLVANRIQQGLAREAFSIIEQGIADAADVDRAIKFGPAFRYATTGQLEVSDLGGLDIWCIVGDNLLKVMDNSPRASELLRAKVKEGKLGLKSGEGFFLYDELKAKEIKDGFMKRLINQAKASKYYS